MRILTKQKIDRISKEAARMEKRILESSSCEVSDQFVGELTKCFERLVKMAGGEYGYGKYTAGIVDHYTKVERKPIRTYQDPDMGKVIRL